MYKNNRILAVVPARGGSKGIKLKNLKLVDNVPLVGHVGNVVKKVKLIDKSVVSTDNKRIKKVATEYGLEAPFFRSKDLSGDFVGDVDVLTEALLKSEEIYNQKFDVILMLQPTCPLRKPYHITSCIKKLIDENLDSVWTISKCDTKSHPLKLLNYKNNRLSYLNKNGSNIIARQQLDTLYFRNGAAYALKRNFLLNKKKLLSSKTGALLTKEIIISIDNLWDLEIVNYLYKKENSI